MGDPKLVRGMLGWAAIGDGLIVYAKTKAEAERRFRAAQEADSSEQSTDSTTDVTQDVESGPPADGAQAAKPPQNLPRRR